MILQLQPNKWTCLPTAFAMVFDIPLSEVLLRLGHDGSDVVSFWSHLSEPYRRKSFHIQELILVANDLGFTVTSFEPQPVASAMKGAPVIILDHTKYFERIIAINSGVFTGETLTGSRHAIAWDGLNVFDPGNKIKNLNDFQIQCFWRIIKSF